MDSNAFKKLPAYLTLALILLSGCVNEIVQPDTEYRGNIVIGDVVQSTPLELSAVPLDMERTIPTDSIIVTPSREYNGLDPVSLDTVQVTMRYKEGITYWLDHATATD